MLTQAEIDAINAQIEVLETAYAARVLKPDSASNAMGSVSLGSADTILVAIGRLKDKLADTKSPPFERWQFRFPGTV